MTAVPLPLKTDDGKPIRIPRHAPTQGVSRPVWTDYRVQVPVDCNDCEQVAYETAMTGDPFPGLRKARRKRRQDGQSRLYCHEHARIQQQQDQADFPPGESTGKRRSGGQRYIA